MPAALTADVHTVMLSVFVHFFMQSGGSSFTICTASVTFHVQYAEIRLCITVILPWFLQFRRWHAKNLFLHFLTNKIGFIAVTYSNVFRLIQAFYVCMHAFI